MNYSSSIISYSVFRINRSIWIKLFQNRNIWKSLGLNQTKIKIIAFCIESSKFDCVEQSPAHGDALKKESNGLHYHKYVTSLFIFEFFFIDCSFINNFSITEKMVTFFHSAASGSLWLFDKEKLMEIPYSSAGY